MSGKSEHGYEYEFTIITHTRNYSKYICILPVSGMISVNCGPVAASDIATNSGMAATIQKLLIKKSLLVFAAMLFIVRGLRNCTNDSNLLRVNGTDMRPILYGLMSIFFISSSSSERRGSVVVSTSAYHAADRGSNPARTRRDY